MHPIFQTRELLDEILSWLPRADLATTIRINQFWFIASASVLWRITSLSNALKLLGRTQTISPGQYRFEFRDWKRFALYSSFVRSLRANDLDTFALVTALKSRPHSSKKSGGDNLGLEYLFPTCRSLEWHGTSDLGYVNLNALIPPTLEYFSLLGSDFGPAWFHNLCQIFITRLKCLRLLHIEIDTLVDPDDEYSNDLSESRDSFHRLLTTFASTLTSVEVPHLFATPATLKKLSNVKNLSNLIVHQRGRRVAFNDLIRRVKAYRVSGGLGRFASLRHAAFGPMISQPLVFNFFPPRVPFPALRTLHWHMLETRCDMGMFLATIAATCPQLELLQLGRTNIDNPQILPWVSVRPILQCKKLVHLSLYCIRAEMALENLVELVRSREGPTGWRVVEVLPSEPFDFQETLLLFAKYSPNVQALGIYVHFQGGTKLFSDIPAISSLLHLNTGRKDLRNHLAYIHSELRRQLRQSGTFFPRLSILNFTDSIFTTDSIRPVASFLWAMCQNPIYLNPWANESVRQIYERIVTYHIEIEKLTNQFLPTEACKYAQHIRKQTACLDADTDTDVLLCQVEG